MGGHPVRSVRAARAQAEPVKASRAQLGQPGDSKNEKIKAGAPSLPLVQSGPAVEKIELPRLDVPADKKDPSAETDEFLLQIKDYPKAKQLFGLKSEREMFEDIRREKLERNGQFNLPEATKVSPPVEPERSRPRLTALAEPSYLCYRRDFFEQRTFERHGWNLGIIQPPIAAAVFYADLMALPINWVLDPCRDFECNAGLCLPGDPTPLMWYRRVK